MSNIAVYLFDREVWIGLEGDQAGWGPARVVVAKLAQRRHDASHRVCVEDPGVLTGPDSGGMIPQRVR